MTRILAKLTVPRFSKIYHRKRLYKLLDSARKQPIIWLTSPAGSGKTTLTSSYLQKMKLTSLWYQIDEGDTDIASFFSYLSQAASSHIEEPHNLPTYNSEYLAGITTFSRNYFRTLFSSLKSSSVIVFDNYQDVSLMSKLHHVLMVGLAEIPEGINVIFISRENPPVEYSRLQASEILKQIKWDDIQLDSKETAAICKLKLNNKSIDSSYLSAIHEQAQGWLAGLVLMLENTNATDILTATNNHESQQKIFDYFVGEIMSKSLPVTQQLLLKTALLPKVSVEDAVVLSNISNAELILCDLAERNYFTVFHSGNNPTYEYHPLFRKYLLEEGKKFFTEDELVSLKLHAATLLEKSGFISDALQILLTSKQWQEAIKIILKNAKDHVLKGYTKTFFAWLEQLPQEYVNKNSWLMYWKGMCYIAVDPKHSRSFLEKAFYRFKENDDITGQLISFCSIVDTYVYERSEMISLDKWLEEVNALIATIDDFNSSELGIRLSCAMFMALIYRQPDHPDLPLWAKRAYDIALSNVDPRLRLSIGNHLILYYMWWVSDKSQVEIIINALKPIAGNGAAPPLVRVTWQMIEAGYHWMITGDGQSIQSAQKGLDIANETGVHILDVYLLTHALFSSLFQRDYETMDLYLNKMAPLIEHHRHMDAAWYYILYARREDAVENYDLAYNYSKLALEHSIKSGRPYMFGHAYVVYGKLLFKTGEKEKAYEYIDEALTLGIHNNFPVIIYLSHFFKMEFIIDDNEEELIFEQMKKCLELGKLLGKLSASWINSYFLEKFYSLALEYNLEKEYVIECIRQEKLLPKDHNAVHFDWPYQIKIYTLGLFRIVIEGKELAFNGKAQKKVLELLKVLISYGGYKVNIEILCEALWPDADGDAAYQSFTMTLKRLRKLLNNKEALVLNDAKLSFNAEYVWIDVFLFEKGLVNNDAQVKVNSVMLYKGDFLEYEAEAEWMLPFRHRLRQKYLLHKLEFGQKTYDKKPGCFSLKVVSKD